MSNYRKVQVSELWVDTAYQRIAMDVSVNRLLQSGFDETMLNTLIVNHRTDGRHVVIDGGHRLEMARISKGDSFLLPCIVHEGMNREEEADYYVRLQTAKKSMTPHDKYKANLFGGKPVEVAVDRILTELGLHMVAQARSSEPGPRVGAVQGCISAYVSHGEEPFKRAMKILWEAWGGQPQGFSRDGIRALTKIVSIHPEIKDDRMVVQLAGTPSAAQFLASSRSTAAGMGLSGNNILAPVVNTFIARYNVGLRKNKLEGVSL